LAVAELVNIGSSVPSRTAALQGVLGIAALQAQSRNALETYIGADGQVVEFFSDAATWPVDIAVARSGSRWFVWIRGTTNTQQWITNIGGANVAQPWGVSTVQVNSGFLAQAQRVGRLLVSLWDVQGAPAYVAWYGHSLGGAVAQLLAWSGRTNYPACVHEVMTYGGPQAASGGQSAGVVATQWRWCSELDVVPALPSNIVSWYLYQVFAPPTWLAQGVNYVHYGTALTLDAAGYVNDPHPNPVPLPDGVGVGPIAEHTVLNYWGRLRQVVIREGGPAAAFVAAEFARPLLFGPDRSTPAPATITRIYLPPAGFIDVPNIPPTIGALFGGSAMANGNNRLTGGVPFQVTLNFTWGTVGWQEVYFCYVRDAQSAPNVSIYNWTDQLLLMRRGILANKIAINYVRIKRLVSPKWGRLEGAGSLSNTGLGLVSGDVNLDQAVLFKSWSQDLLKQSDREIRGFVKSWIADVGTDPTGTAPLTAASVAGRTAFTNFLSTQWVTGVGVYQGENAIKTYLDDNTAPRVNVQSLSTTTSGLLVLHMTPNSLLVNPGELVTLRHRKQKCISGFSGRFAVVSFEATVPEDLITISYRPCCGPGVLADAVVTAQKYGLDWWAVNLMQSWVQTSRKTGKPIGLRRSRRAGCCK